MSRVVVLADTHIRRGGRRRLGDDVFAALDGADAILHAGDVTDPSVLDELAGFGPVFAVLGNNDVELTGVLPESRSLSIDGLPIAMIHDSGPRAGREGRMARRFPQARVVVFGHSHVPHDGLGLGRQVLFNPGSPTDRRGQPFHTFGVIEVADGELVDHRVVRIEG